MDQVAQVVSAARSKDPSLDAATAERLAVRALQVAEGDAAEVARQLLADDPSVDVSHANAVAVAAVGVVTGVEP